MADLVNPLGGLVPGTVQGMVSVSAAPRTAPGPIRPPSSSSPSSTAVAPGKTTSAAEGATGSGQAGDLEEAAQAVAEFIQSSPTDLKFGVDEATGQYFFKVVDPKTHEVIRQVPSEEILAMARRLQELNDPKGARGVLVDKEG